MARGHWKQLRQYIQYALNMGFNQREICEVISQAGWYRGWPCVEEALEQANAAFGEQGN
jgi:alkylhydroperoxidase/carboxymuconolactone decarboxylase family protein YurZ